MSDPVLIQHVLLNLVQNSVETIVALRLNGGKIFLYTEILGKSVEILVEDNGIGPGTSQIGSVFDTYYLTKDGGKGSGLSICSSIVEKYSGTIKVTSEEGVGATVRVVLPNAGIK